MDANLAALLHQCDDAVEEGADWLAVVGDGALEGDDSRLCGRRSR